LYSRNSGDSSVKRGWVRRVWVGEDLVFSSFLKVGIVLRAVLRLLKVMELFCFFSYSRISKNDPISMLEKGSYISHYLKAVKSLSITTFYPNSQTNPSQPFTSTTPGLTYP